MRWMETQERELEATTDDGEMVVVITEPKAPPEGGGHWPTVLYFIDAPGLRPATRDSMALLASNGYRVVTPDLHHRVGRLLCAEPKDAGTEHPAGGPRGWLGAMTDDQIQHDGAAALAAAGVSPDTPIVTIGFCLGTRAAYRLIEANPDRVLAGACFHPSMMGNDTPGSPHLTAATTPRPMYFGVGEADTVQSIEMQQRFFDAVDGVDHVEVVTFPGVDHGFTWPGYPNYDENAAETSWAKTLELFATAFA